MKKLSHSQAKNKVSLFFKQEIYTPEEMRKVKKIAVEHKIKLKDHKKLFCNHCLSKLSGKTRVTSIHKTIICEFCKKPNRFRID